MKTKLKTKKRVVPLSKMGTPQAVKIPKEISPTRVDYEEHWKGMPEFNQPGIKPIKSLIVHFLNKDDMLKFSKIIGFQITAKTKSVWYPVQDETPRWDKRYVDKKK